MRMQPCPIPTHPNRGIEYTDLGDMLEIRMFDVRYAGWLMRWDAIVDGAHIIFPGRDHFCLKHPLIDPLTRLEQLRDKARRAMLRWRA